MHVPESEATRCVRFSHPRLNRRSPLTSLEKCLLISNMQLKKSCPSFPFSSAVLPKWQTPCLMLIADSWSRLPWYSLHTRTDGGAGTTLYVKDSGSGNNRLGKPSDRRSCFFKRLLRTAPRASAF